MENSVFYKVGLNIEGLRKFYGLTQEELALEIGVTKQAISKYELGISIPDRDNLMKICRFFRITENDLIYENYHNIETIVNTPIHTKDYQRTMFDKMLPIVCSNSAMENPYFKEAYELHQYLYNAIIDNKDFDYTLINKCADLYDEASKNSIIEGVANSLWWLMLEGFILTFFSPQMLESAELFIAKKIGFKEVLKKGFLRSVDMDTNSEDYKTFEKTRIEFLEEYEADIFYGIKQLKRSKEYSDLGDYYLALSYLFNLISYTESEEMNTAVANEMMTAFAILGNPYAQKFKNMKK